MSGTQPDPPCTKSGGRGGGGGGRGGGGNAPVLKAYIGMDF